MIVRSRSNDFELSKINQKTLAEGERLPSVKLKDGQEVQTGTVATMLHNVRLYNEAGRGDIEKELVASIPTLINIGLFELFSPDEWISDKNPGRCFVGHKAKEYLTKK